MVMGHIGFGEKFDLFIHAFHMPMFFFVSGFLFKDQITAFPFLMYLKKKARSLLIPYFVFATFHYVISVIINNDFTIEALKGLVFPDTYQIPIAGALWFLISLFSADIIYYWICKIRNKRIQWIVVSFLAVFGQIVPDRFGVVLPFALGSALVGVGLMHIGKALSQYERQITSLKIYQILFFGALTGISIMKSGMVNMRAGVYPDAFALFWINAVCASILGLSIAKRLDVSLKCSFIKRYFVNVGRNSIVYLCLNQITIWSCRKIVIHLQGLHFSIGTAMIENLIVLGFSLIILLLLSLLFEHTFLRVLIGRFKGK